MIRVSVESQHPGLTLDAVTTLGKPRWHEKRKEKKRIREHYPEDAYDKYDHPSPEPLSPFNTNTTLVAPAYTATQAQHNNSSKKTSHPQATLDTYTATPPPIEFTPFNTSAPAFNKLPARCNFRQPILCDGDTDMPPERELPRSRCLS